MSGSWQVLPHRYETEFTWNIFFARYAHALEAAGRDKLNLRACQSAGESVSCILIPQHHGQKQVSASCVRMLMESSSRRRDGNSWPCRLNRAGSQRHLMLRCARSGLNSIKTLACSRGAVLIMGLQSLSSGFAKHVGVIEFGVTCIPGYAQV